MKEDLRKMRLNCAASRSTALDEIAHFLGVVPNVDDLMDARSHYEAEWQIRSVRVGRQSEA
jgi:hypothetical protein